MPPALSKKFAGLPRWAWLAILAAGLGVAIYMRNRSNAAAAGVDSATSDCGEGYTDDGSGNCVPMVDPSMATADSNAGYPPGGDASLSPAYGNYVPLGGGLGGSGYYNYNCPDGSSPDANGNCGGSGSGGAINPCIIFLEDGTPQNICKSDPGTTTVNITSGPIPCDLAKKPKKAPKHYQYICKNGAWVLSPIMPITRQGGGHTRKPPISITPGGGHGRRKCKPGFHISQQSGKCVKDHAGNRHRQPQT